jgi:HEPN domain-containing protein
MITPMDEPDEIDRQPAIGMFLFGESFLDAGRHLARATDKRELRLRFDDPIYFLYSHALELTLKALLRSKGYSARRLASRQFGHQLKVLWQECLKAGLSTQPNEDAFMDGMIEILDPLATSYELRYLKVGSKQMPCLDELELALVRLRAAIEPIVRSAPLPQ